MSSRRTRLGQGTLSQRCRWPSLLLMVPLLACAQTYRLDTVGATSGGGTSTAGVYTLTGTIGQPALSRVNSRDFTIDGGFWSIIAAIQQPGTPFLSVRLTETNTVVVSWPITWPGFVLTESPDLNVPTWTDVTIAPVDVAVGEDRVDKQVIVQKPTGNRFYRLKHP